MSSSQLYRVLTISLALAATSALPSLPCQCGAMPTAVEAYAIASRVLVGVVASIEATRFS